LSELGIVLALLLVLGELVLASFLVLLSSLLGMFGVAGGGLLAFLVLGTEEVCDCLEEIGGDLELGGDESEDESLEAGTTLLVRGSLIVLV
jgi:hypothetical protein